MPEQNSEKAASVARSREWQECIFFVCEYVVRQAQINNSGNKAALIAAFLKIANTEKPRNLYRVGAAVLIDPAILVKITSQGLGNEATDAELVTLLTANMVAYAELCEE